MDGIGEIFARGLGPGHQPDGGPVSGSGWVLSVPGTSTADKANRASVAAALEWDAARESAWQQTLRAPIGCRGVGLHTGRLTRMTLQPAAVDAGVTFVRSDMGGAGVEARFDKVVDTNLCTMIGQGEARVGTVEHVMAALRGAGIDNAVVELDGPEVPILDGSAAGFLFLIDCAGIVTQSVRRRVIDVLRPVRVQYGTAWAALLPQGTAGAPGLDMQLDIDFAAAAIGRQSCAVRLTPDSFRHELATARTFTQSDEIERLRAAGLALGGTLDNAVVVDGDTVLNPGGLRMDTEFVRHKLLDAVGDLALAGHALRGRFEAHCTGHRLNSRLLHALFADANNWRFATAAQTGWIQAA